VRDWAALALARRELWSWNARGSERAVGGETGARKDLVWLAGWLTNWPAGSVQPRRMSAQL